ncbi:SdpI family protein [Corynebacterium sp.]|uniref:SdpI family protein n=1 Tax=Corynebacterium sp. TaxID=1720 RepID=UPI0026E0FE87|nr:SdpI family protein [Corynebacterium sp.]MDO5511538.1 SdpI family protein [Corynebacterium sp.]
MIFVAMLLIILAVALILFGVLAWTRKLPGNSVVGLRVPEVRKSQEAWQAAHAAAGPIWTFGGVALLFGGLLGFVSGGWMWVFTAVTVLIALVAVSLGANVGARTASLVDAAGEDEAGGCGQDCNCGAPAPAPAVDIDALRKAATEADRN